MMKWLIGVLVVSCLLLLIAAAGMTLHVLTQRKKISAEKARLQLPDELGDEDDLAGS